MIWVPVMYLCILEQCEWLQQQTVYTNRDLCQKIIAEKVEWYQRNARARVDGVCIDVNVELKK